MEKSTEKTKSFFNSTRQIGRKVPIRVYGNKMDGRQIKAKMGGFI